MLNVLSDSLDLLATLLEASIGKEELITRLGELGFSPSAYQYVLHADPTKTKKYVAWILFMLEKGRFQAGDILEHGRAKILLQRFEKARPRLSQKDLYAYKSIDEVEAAIGQAGSSAEARKVAKAGMIKVADKNGYEIYQATTVAALMKASNHTDWCTTQKDTAEDYIKRRVRFYVVFKDGVKQGAIVFGYGQVTTYHPEQNEYKFTLYDPDLEDALGFLSQEDYAKLPIVANIIKDPEKAYYYAHDVIEGEWPAGEAAIVRDPYYAYLYAHDVLKGERFPAGEPVLASNSQYAYLYAHDVLKLPDAEARRWGKEYRK